MPDGPDVALHFCRTFSNKLGNRCLNSYFSSADFEILTVSCLAFLSKYVGGND